MDNLHELVALEVISIADNSFATWTDPGRKDVRRHFQWVKKRDDEVRPFLIAGAGLSLLIRAISRDEVFAILYDVAESARNMENNIASLGLDLSEIDAIVLSHGHFDHTGGLLWTLEKIGKTGFPVYVHPRMFLRKAFELEKKEGKEIREIDTIPSEDEIAKAGGVIVSTTEPVLLGNGMLLRTGEVPRITRYEKGISSHRVFIDDEWNNDSEVREDVSLVAKVKGRGLVVISGCSHAGIINIIHEAQLLTGETHIHGVIGGLHLAGGVPEETMKVTVEEMKEINPKLLVPCHCTGWRARHLMSAEMPDAYVEGSVGHKYIIGEGDVS